MAAELVRAIVLSWLLGHNYGDHTDAVMRYIQAESGFRPCIEKRTGHFLLQWVGSRVVALHAFAGPGCLSVEAQLSFLDHELRGGLYARFWNAPPQDASRVFRRTFGQGRLKGGP